MPADQPATDMAIVDQVRDRDGVLLVMSTSATGLVSQRRGSVSAQVLSETRQPVLLIGPAVPDPVTLSSMMRCS